MKIGENFEVPDAAITAIVALTLVAAAVAAHSAPAASATGAGEPAGFHVCGDPTNDGVANALDALFVLQATAGLIDVPPPAVWATDTNNDGDVNARDALFILQYDAGLVSDLDCVT